ASLVVAVPVEPALVERGEQVAREPLVIGEPVDRAGGADAVGDVREERPAHNASSCSASSAYQRSTACATFATVGWDRNSKIDSRAPVTSAIRASSTVTRDESPP